jgi:CO/xanthine dehydrogenase Mo-binding subunit
MAEATQPQKFKVIGTRPIRHDGIDKVTGRAKYGADYAFPGMLHGKVLRSPYAHARIKSINVDKALKLPGVKTIVTGADMPPLPESKSEAMGEAAMNPRWLSLNILARGKALYDGHAVAAVAATSPHIAEEALRLIEVEYEPLAPVMTVERAMEPGAPILIEELRNPESGDKPTNVAMHLPIKKGDPEAGFKAADFIVEREFKTAMVHQGYIEPHNAVGIYNPDGQATIYCSTQGAFDVRSMSAKVLGVEVGKIKVVPAEIGGGFGGKTTIYLEPLSVLLSQKTGHPVKMVMSRSEVLRASGPTSGSTIRVKMGATKDGKITAAKVWMAYEAGAFPGSPVMMGAMTILAPYNLENVQIDAYDVVVNRPKTAAYRAPGATNAGFAAETVIDELAEKCGIDPLDLRIKNGAHEGTPHPAGPPYRKIGFIISLGTILGAVILDLVLILAGAVRRLRGRFILSLPFRPLCTCT